MRENLIKIEIIKDYIGQNKLSKTKFAEMCKLSVNTLNKILNNQTNVYVIALFKIAKVLNMPVHLLCN